MIHENFYKSEASSPTGSSDRMFGLVFCVAFAVVALLRLVHDKPVLVWPLVASGGFLAFALVWPSILHPLNVLWTRFGALINKVTTPILAGLIFFVIFTPTALVARALGKVSIRRKSDPDAETYWVSKGTPDFPTQSMRNQF